jgi:hypothetical protein
MNNRRNTFVLFTLLIAAVATALVVHVRAEDCVPPPIYAQSSATSFPQYTAVTVNIDPSFSATQQAQIRQAFSNWQGSTNNAGVSFQFTYSATAPAATSVHTVQVSQTQFPATGTTQRRGATSTNGNTVTGLQNATIRLDDRITDDRALLRVAAHEIGHIYGLADFPDDGVPRASVMSDGTDFNDYTSGADHPLQPCDVEASRTAGNYQPPPDRPPNCPPATCPQRYEWDPDQCRCVYTYSYSTERDACPIILDIYGDGIELTTAANGVYFDFDTNHHIEKLAWTAPSVDDAWLVLDRNGNGRIDNGSELFSNYAPQQYSVTPYGFLALAEFDTPGNGGNSDGIISRRDAIFPSLRLWQDVNHNGISEQWELHRLKELGVKSISLDYKKVKRTDEYGNQFIFRAKVQGTRNSTVGRWAWDVVLPKANAGTAPY